MRLTEDGLANLGVVNEVDRALLLSERHNIVRFAGGLQGIFGLSSFFSPISFTLPLSYVCAPVPENAAAAPGHSDASTPERTQLLDSDEPHVDSLGAGSGDGTAGGPSVFHGMTHAYHTLTCLAAMLSPMETSMDELPPIKKGDTDFEIDPSTMPSFQRVLAHQWRIQQRRTLYSRRQYAELLAAVRFTSGFFAVSRVGPNV